MVAHLTGFGERLGAELRLNARVESVGAEYVVRPLAAHVHRAPAATGL